MIELDTSIESDSSQLRLIIPGEAGAHYHAALKDVSYKHWRFEIAFSDSAGHALLMARFWEHGREWTTRKYYLTPQMTRSEIVQTAFLLVKVAEEHEIREKFTYRGQSIFGPHFDSDKLHALCGTSDHQDIRGIHRADT